jgi:polar amino acid transport system substrate-binding protein
MVIIEFLKGADVKRLCFFIILLAVLAPGWAMAEPFNNSSASRAKLLVIGFSTTSLDVLKEENRKWLNSSVDFWNLIAQELKRPYVFKAMPFEEILKALEEGTIDITATPIMATAEREERFDLSTTLGGARLGVATRYEGWDYPWLSAVRIFFSWSIFRVILALVAALVFVGIIVWFVERKNNPQYSAEGPRRGIGTGIYWAGSTLASGVCLGVSLRTTTGRILGLLWTVLCAIAFSAVVASLTYSLGTQGHASLPIDSDRLKGMHIGVFKGSTTARILETLGGRYTLCDNSDACVKALLDKKTDGFMYDEGYLHYLSETRYRGKISVFPTDLKPYRRAFAMPKDSSLRKPFNVALLKIVERPVGEALTKQLDLNAYLRDRPTATAEEGPNRRPGRRQK